MQKYILKMQLALFSWRFSGCIFLIMIIENKNKKKDIIICICEF